jgi:hypothetical protein
MKENIIYHYCGMDSFFGIIANKNIRLSNAYKTNDSAELEWIFSIMENSMAGVFKTEFVSTLRKSYRGWLENHFRTRHIINSAHLLLYVLIFTIKVANRNSNN